MRGDEQAATKNQACEFCEPDAGIVVLRESILRTEARRDRHDAKQFE
jgi:hypothetical protein